jgi:hypothetical protein
MTKSQHDLHRRQLKRREDWQLWKEAEWKQLTSYDTQNMFGKPIIHQPKSQYSGSYGRTSSRTASNQKPMEPAMVLNATEKP